MLRLRPRKGRVGTVGHVGSHRLFVQQVQHTVGAGKHLGQAGTEVGQCHHRAKGAQSRQGAHEKSHLDKCVAAFTKVGRELGVIK